MNIRPYIILFLLTAVLTLGSNTFAQVSVRAAAQSEIYVNEPFRYQIQIYNWTEGVKVDDSALKNWSPVYQGQSSETRIVNGRTTQKINLNYTLTATQPGKQTIPAVTVEINNRRYTTNEVDIDVLTPDASDRLGLEMSLDAREAFVGQPITLTVHWYIEANLANRLESYNFVVPAWQDTETFNTEQAPPPDIKNAKPMSITINGEEITAYQSAATYNDHTCAHITASKIILPRRSGPITLAAPTVTCAIDQSRRSRSRSFFDPFNRTPKDIRRYITQADPAVLTVKPLPVEGRPPYFTGLIGRYAITADAAPTEVNVGDPITLNITIEGDLLKYVTLPDLAKIPGMIDDFKIAAEQAAPQTENNRKTFTQAIRAKHDRVEQIPPIPLTYFDVDREQYVTVTSDPIPLEVAPTRIVTTEQAVGREFQQATSEIEAIRRGVAANVYDQSKLLKNAAFSPVRALTQPAYLIWLVVPLLLFILTGVFRLMTAGSPEKKQARVRSAAARKALSRLNRLSSTSDSLPEDILDILRQYIGDRFGRSAQSLTQHDCRELLQNACREEQTVERFCALFERCENSRYAGSNTADTHIDIQQINILIKTIEKELKSTQK